MKRTLLILGIIILLIAFLGSGCTKKTESLDLFGEGKNSAKMEQVTLTFYFIARQYKEEDIRAVLDEIEKRTAKTLHIKLNFNFLPLMLYKEKITEIIAKGKPCDVFEYNNYNILEELQDSGYALDITSLLPKYAPAFYSKLDPGNIALHKNDNILLAVPNNFIFSNRMCALVRDDLMQKYNIPPIKNLDDLEVYLDKVNKNEDIIITLAVNDTILGKNVKHGAGNY